MRPARLLHSDTVVIISVTEGPPDSDGVPTTTVTETPWEGVLVTQVDSGESNTNSHTTTVTYRVSGPHPAITPKSVDLVRWNRKTYAITDEPLTISGRLRLNKTRLHMKLTTG